MANDTMKAAQAADYGSPDVVSYQDAPKPTAGDGQVVLKMKAAGVNPADWKYLGGAFKQYVPLKFPWTPGLEGAGVVDSVGAGVSGLKAGQEVFGIVNGPFAEYAVALANELQPKPSGLSWEEAAGVPVGALTAWSALEAADVKAGQRVLVHGGAGGVGLYVVQLAKAKGAHVIATTSAKNADFAKSLGADEVVDYNATKFEDAVKDVDAVIDTVGGELIQRSLAVIKPGGVFVTVAGMVDSEAGASRDIRVTGTGRAAPQHLGEIADLIAQGKLKSKVGEVMPLADAGKALALSQTGHGRGRIVLKIG